MSVERQDLRGQEDLGRLGSKRPPLVVVWRVTEQCDLGCRFCEYSRHLPRSRGAAEARTVLGFGRVLRDYAAATGRVVHFSFLGGEPLLWWPLQDVARILKHEFALQTGVTTNGTRLHLPSVRSHLLDDYDQVTVSVDGLEVWYATCRQAPGLWRLVREGVSALAAQKSRRGWGPLLRVNTVLMRSSIHELEALCGELAAWGVERVSFNTLGGSEGDAFYEQERLRPEDVAWLRGILPGLRARLAPLGLSVSGSDGYVTRLERQAQKVPWPMDDCQAGAQFLFVTADGRIGPCDATTESYGIPVAEVQSADDLLSLPRLLAERRMWQRHAACNDCRSTAVFGKFVEAAA